jgi:hypothetical protein
MTKQINVKRKQSVYFDKDLQAAVAHELNELRNQGYYDITVGDIIRKRLRTSYNIPKGEYVK